MIVGENSREQDMDVNVTNEKKQTNMRSSSADAKRFAYIPHRELSLEQLSSLFADDEFVEITPEVDSACAKKFCKPTSARAAGRKSAPARATTS